MTTANDQPSGNHAAGSETPGAVRVDEFDPLSDVLRNIRLKGALFFMVDATSPWCVEVPQAEEFADIILPEARHIISYHIAVEGRGLAGVPGSDPVAFEAGDIIVFPHEDSYVMSSKPDVPPELDHAETIQFFRNLAAGKLPFVIPEGGGEMPKAKFICGFLGCDMTPFNPLLGTLPRMLHVGYPGDDRTDLLDQLVSIAMKEMQSPRAGGASIRLGLSELMFVELLRRHLNALSVDQPGWLAGLRDSRVGRALALLHAQPSKSWTIETLAQATGVSRSVLAERFTRTIGEPPMRYLTLWRMQLAARKLTESNLKVVAIAEQVGFRSEAAFSRTFKKIAGFSPTEWRRTRSKLSENNIKLREE